MDINPTTIKNSIAMVSEQSDDVLSHTYKCLLTSAKPAELKQLEPLMSAILKELRARHKPLPKDTPADEQQPKPQEDEDV